MQILKDTGRKTYFIITVDTECDKGPGWLIQKPLKFRSAIDGIPSILEPVFQQFGAKATYLLSPEVIQNDDCVSILRDVQKKGAELGTHLHGEFIEPHTKLDTDATWEMQNTYSRDIEYQKLKNLTALFEEKFGYRPTSFRAGRFGIGENTLPILAELGYTVDSSVAPYCSWKDKGGFIEFFGAPTQPYHPDATNPKKKGKLPILEVPVTVGKTWYEYIPKSLLNSVPKYPRLWSIPQIIFKEQFKPIFLRPTFQLGTFENMKSLILSQIKKNQPHDVFLVMLVHNVDFVPGCSPYAQTESESQKFLNRLSDILRFVQSIPVKFITLSEVRNCFQNNPQQCP